MEGLVRLETSADELKIAPALAESWSFSTSNELHIHLRDNIFWSNGSKLTASDFIFAWKKVLRHPTALKAKALFDSVEGARKFATSHKESQVLGVTAPDPLILSFILTRLPPIFL